MASSLRFNTIARNTWKSAFRRWGLESQHEARLRLDGPAGSPPLEHYETAVLRPLDERVHAWLREQSFRDPAKAAAAGRWPSHLAERLSAERILGAVKDWQHGLGRVVGVQGVAGLDVVHPGYGGPTALAGLLGSIGVALRQAFVEPQQPAAERLWGDRARVYGVQGLFRRLAVNPRWLAEHGLQVDGSLAEGLLTGELLAPRILWAYVASTGPADRAPTTEEIDMNWRRATGDGPTTADRLVMDSLHPPDLSRLRGLAYALLMEESILSRFGRDWYRSAGAYRWLREIWDGEDGQSVEQMADAAGIGTIDGSPIYDRSLQAMDRGVCKQMESS